MVCVLLSSLVVSALVPTAVCLCVPAVFEATDDESHGGILLGGALTVIYLLTSLSSN